ncbi:helix-turn-helix domain-containing protein [Seonamhaeicola maritimus]|uniref:Helix-turn-helix transcriptional regulator n=1 Tax=Seonamhaeicola maritimus TaxID=2591822 RepID=A0A5C7GM29_9FLAO|nr:AraC family transcriptional regulator [Seonamhaeicola maritimus]TXG38971.1 helix-turn-helix transcriptional regulator [Seonamhaeicola maritimus]
MNFNIYNTIILAGIIQGFIFVTVVLCSKKFRSKSTLILAALVFCYSISNVIYIIPDIGLITLIEAYHYFFIPLAPLIPVLIYFYVLFFLNPIRKFSVKDKLLFVPFIFFLAVFLAFKFVVLFDSLKTTEITPSFLFWIRSNEIFSVIYSIVLLVSVLIKVYNHDKLKQTFDLKKIKPSLAWLKLMLTTIFFFTLVWAYLTYANIFGNNIGENDFYILWISMAALIYLMGHIGIYKFGVIKERKRIRRFIISKQLDISQVSINKHIRDFENYLKEEKAYLNPHLSLESVAEHLKISPSYLSRTIHSELDSSFSDYVHNLRVQEAKSYLCKPEFSNYTMVSIGLEAGFNSRSSFFNIFKLETGKTPYQYKKEYSKNNLKR